MGDEQRRLKLVELIYEAVAEPHRWPRFLDQLAQVLSRATIGITLKYPRAGDPGHVVTYGIDPAAMRTYQEHCFARDPLLPAVSRLPAGVTEETSFSTTC